MAKGDEITTKFKVDVSDLKKGINEANQQIKLADATFKAATAGMDSWSKSTDGLKAKLDQLKNTLEAQKSKLANYAEELKRQESAYTKNGDKITQLKAKLKELANQGVSKTSAEYKKYENALAACEKEQTNNEKAVDRLKVTILEQQGAINKTEADINKYGNSLDNLEKSQSEAAKSAEKQASAYDSLKGTIDDQQKRLDELKSKYASVVLEQGKNSDSAKDLAKEIDSLSGELNDNKTKLNEADKAADELDKSIDDLSDSAKDSSDGFTVMKGALASLVADGIQKAVGAMGDFIKDSINVGKNFDASMSQVAAVSGATGDELEALRDKAKEMGASTKFSASEAADAFNYMAMAGWKTEDMLSGISGILDLAAASGEDLATTSDIVTDALTAFGKSAEDAGTLADIMAAASSNANTNVSMMGETFKYVAPVAGALGYSMEDVGVAVGLMANSGIKAGQAGTALRSTLSRLTKPTEEMNKAMVALGIATEETIRTVDQDKLRKAYVKAENASMSLKQAEQNLFEVRQKYGESSTQAENALIKVKKATNALMLAQADLKKEEEGSIVTTQRHGELLTDSEGNMRSLSEVIQILREKFADLDEQQQAQMASTLFGQEAMSGMLGIINASEEDFNKLTEAINNSEGAAAEMAAIMQDNLQGDLTTLGSKVEGVQIALYEKLEPALRSGVAALSKLVDALGWVVEHSEAFITTIEIVGAAVAAFLVTMNWTSIMSAAVSALNMVKNAFIALHTVMMANPWALAAAAIAALVVAGVKLVQHWANEEKAIKSVEQAEQDLNAARQDTINAQVSYADAIDRQVDAQNRLAEAEEKAGITGAELFEQVQAGTLDYANMTAEQQEAYKAYIANEEAMQKVKEATEALTEAKRQETVASFEHDLALAKESGSYDEFKQSVVDAYNEGKISAEDARDLIGAAMSEMSRASQKTFMEDIPSDITNGLDPKKYETTGQKIKKWFGSIGDDIRKVWDICWTKIKEIWEKVSSWFKEKVLTPLKKAFDETISDIKNFFSNAKKKIEEIWQTVANWFNEHVVTPIKNFFEPLVKWFTELFTNIKEFIESTFEVIGELASGCVEIVKKVWGIVKTWFDEHVIQPVKKFFTDLFNNISKFASDAWNKIKETWSVVKNWFNQNIIEPVSNFFSNMWNKLKQGAKDAWQGIKDVFGKVKDWFEEKFTAAWTAVKNVFSTGGKIFDGIKEGITSAFKNVVNAIIRGINKVIAVPFNAINKVLDKIRNFEILGLSPFSGLGSISVPQIPELARGGILKRGQMGLLEGNGAEAVVPLERNKQWIKAVANDLLSELSQIGINAGGNNNLTNNRDYNFTQNIYAPKQPSRIELYRQTRNLLAYANATGGE